MFYAHFWRRGLAFGAVAALALSAAAAPAFAGTGAPTSHELAANTRFFVPAPDRSAVTQIAGAIKAHKYNDAFILGQMVVTPQAVWFTKGTPAEVKKAVATTMKQAAAQKAVPVLVAYNVPGRDCAQYSAGGAATGDDYKAWIDAFAAGLGKSKAVVILEPDGLALLPTDCGQPDTFDRVGLIAYAGSKIEASDPNVSVYLDAGHSKWHNVADASTRLVAAGVANVQGFFLNVSNFQWTANLNQYGNWISNCIAIGTVVTPGSFGCPDQYWNGGPLPSKIAQLLGEWQGGALDGNGIWSDTSDTPALNTSGINLRYANTLGSVVPTTRWVVDTSRNGAGPWVVPADAPAGDPQDWCNPPDRGAGLRPTSNTGNALVAAYLWVKIPGQSDGQCTRWAPDGGIDPVRGDADPAAGAWFPQQALELAKFASPAFRQLP
jgi:endoglucanase